MFRSLPFLLVILIGVVLFLDPFISLDVKQFLYAMSLTVKSAIVCVLPFIIFSLLFKTMVTLSGRATAVIGLILVCVCCSNVLSTFLSHYVGVWIYHTHFSLIQTAHVASLEPAWVCSFPVWVNNSYAMFAGIVLGIVLGSIKAAEANRLAMKLDGITSKMLKMITYLIPIFVVGFVVKLQFDGVIHIIIRDYAVIFTMVALALFSYILLAYTALNHFNLKATWHCIKNMLPAAIAGFSAMSSAAVMPLTLAGAETNSKNKALARSVIPSTVNIHLVGDCFAIPIFAYALMKSYGMAEPALMSYLIFLTYFVLAKFSVAAIPGGGIIVMLPILERYLGFNTEMLSLITALYILFDPVITCANVLGNGAFSKLIDKLA